MPLFPSDFKKFKYLKHDDKTVHLEHPSGHQIVIAKNAIKGDLRTQLDALCDGGKVADKPQAMAEGGILASIRRSPLAGSGANATQEARDAEDSSKAAAGHNINSTTDVRTPEQKAKAAEYERTGILPGYADGGEVPEVDPATERTREIYNTMQTSNKQSPAPFDPLNPVTPLDSTKFMSEDPAAAQFMPNGAAPEQFNSEAWTQARKQQTQEDSHNAAMAAQDQQKIIAENQARADAGLPPLAVPNVQTGQPPMPQQDAGVAQPMPQPDQGIAEAAPAKADPNDPMSMMQSGMNKRLAGIEQTAAAQSKMGEEQTAALQKSAALQAEAQATYKQHYDHLEAERQGLIKDVQDGHIDPEKYWNDHSRIASGIGMILAGFNPTNNPNAAINYLKFQMEQNLEAQKSNLASKQTLLSANMQQFGNIRDAMQMTRIMQNDLMQNELQQAAAKASSPLAKSAALQAAGQLKMEAAPLFQQFAMRRAMMNMMQNTMNGGTPGQIAGDPSDTSRAEHQIAMLRGMAPMNPEMGKMAEEMSERLVPGVGLAKVKVPQEVRTELTGKQGFDKLARHYYDWAKKNSGNLNPAKIAEGATMAAELQSAYRQAVKGGTFKEGEQEFIERLIPSDPAQFVASMRTLPKVGELIRSNHDQLNVLKNSYGLPAMKQAAMSPDQSAQAMAWAKANPQDPRAAQILNHLGK